MAYKPLKLSDNIRVDCNKLLEDVQGLISDIEKAQRARVPGMDQLMDRCQDCQERVNLIKSEYFPTRK